MYEAYGTPDDAELMGNLGDLDEPYHPDPSLRGGYGGWDEPGKPVQNMDGPVVAFYAQRLRDVGYDAPLTGNARDPDLMQAVAYFQEYKGLDVDGLLGPATNAALDREWEIMNAGVPDAPLVTPGDAPPPFVPGDIPVLPASDVDAPTDWTTWGLVGGVAVLGAVGAWYFWGR